MKFIRTILKLAVILLFTCQLFAGPTIIRDNRVTDLSTTPVLGRGYSIGTNTFQSTCMQNVIITEPSYDMKYSFTQIEDKVLKGNQKKQKTQKKPLVQKESPHPFQQPLAVLLFYPLLLVVVVVVHITALVQELTKVYAAFQRKQLSKGKHGIAIPCW